VKTTLSLVLIVFCAAGLSGDSSANAQQNAPSYDPGYVSQQAPEALPPGYVNGNHGTPSTVSQGMAQPHYPPPPSPGDADDSLIDNGLWEGASVGPGCAICGGGSNVSPPDWYVEQDMRVLLRSRASYTGLGFEFSSEASGTASVVGRAVFSTENTAPNISGVWGMKVGHYFARDTKNRDHYVEFDFWGLNNWRDEASFDGGRMSVFNDSGQKIAEHGNLYSGYAVKKVLDNTNLYVPILNGTIMPGFDRADQQSSSYRSSTNNFEINGRFTPRGRDDRVVLHPDGRWRRECQPGMFVTYVYGMRFFQLNETFNFRSRGRTDVFDPDTGQLIDSTEYAGQYDVMTHNNLLGLQGGLDITFRHCRWDWGFTGRVGPYVNFSDQVSYVTSGVEFSPGLNRRLAGSKHGSSVVAEAGIQASYKFRPNLIGRFSYDFMWVSGVALAPDQIQFVPEPVNEIASNGYLFLHGAKLGLEWMW
jgi:hypothetical protein